MWSSEWGIEMADNGGNNLTNPDLWIRLVYMILFGLLTFLARMVVLVVAAIQFLLVLFAGQGNHNLKVLGDGIAQWTDQAYRFLSFADEQKPYPFQDWPAARVTSSEPGAGEEPPVAQEDEQRPT